MRKGTKFVAIFGGLTLIPVLAACGGSADASSSRSDIPKSLVGNWYQTSKLDSNVVMSATINRDNTIQVNMESRDSSSIYWMGTFDSKRNTKTNFAFRSQGDQDAMSLSIFGSQDSVKKFTYKRGDLSFKFTMTGITSTIHMRKPSEASVPTRSSTPTNTVNRPSYKNPTPKKTIKASTPKTPVKVPSKTRK